MLRHLLRASLLALVLAGVAVPAAGAKTVWLCRPGLADDPCTSSRTATAVATDGRQTIERFPAARTRPIDCFYVYPTVSAQPTLNANLTIDPAETTVARLQASRFSSTCRVYAPMYRQLTVAGLGRSIDDSHRGVDIAYADVAAAWRDYLAHDNHGRGFVLISHSQGTGMLTRLIEQEIDKRPAVRKRLVSALLMGGNILVPDGKKVGGTFQHIPACDSMTALGCVLAYSSFLNTPPDPSIFGRGIKSGFDVIFGTGVTGANLHTLCVNPGAPGGGAAIAEPYFGTAGLTGISTPWVTYPGRYQVSCRRSGTASWLLVDPRSDDPRPTVTEQLGPVWGLHGNDVNITLGNLVKLVARQSAAYTRHAR